MPSKFHFPIARSPKSDPQRNRVYRFESEQIGARHYLRLRRRSIEQIVRAVCRQYGMPKVTVKFEPLGVWAAEWTSPSTITFNPEKGAAYDFITVTHELAHHLHHFLVGDAEHEGHGPEFMACHMSILDTLRFLPIAGMKAILDKYKIRYVDPGQNSNLQTLQRRILRKVA